MASNFSRSAVHIDDTGDSCALMAHDLCPPSAVSIGVGVAGLVGLIGWTVVARHYHMDGPHAGIAAVMACGIPMLLWSLLVDKVHRDPATGIDWSAPRRSAKAGLDISIVKLAGLWATWGCIALFYGLARWYWDGDYVYAMGLFAGAAPVLVVLSIPYVLFLDRRLIDPRDASYAFGQWLIGGAAGKGDPAMIADHIRSWAIKAFFLAFMLSIVPGNFANVIRWNPSDLLINPVNLAGFLIAALFMIDVCFATVGYMVTMKPLGAHIRSANPHIAGWLAALMCYPPFVLMGPGGPLDYHRGTAEWNVWFAGYDALLWAWGAVLVMLTGIYAWATVAFGLRFSNLTNRGIITHGPYRWTRHPAYLSKNMFWWLSTLPFLATTGSWADALRNCTLLAVTSGIYYWRARTEEAHLGEDADYAAYSAWIDAHGVFRRKSAAPKANPETILSLR